MALDFDQFPLNDKLLDDQSGTLSSVWFDFMATFYQTLISYINQYGIYPPNLTAVEIASIQSPMNGQTVYNTTTDTNQYWKNGSWVSYP